MLPHIKKLSLIALTVLALVALGIAACSDDDDSGADTGGDTTALEEQVTKTQVLLALTALRAEELHAFDEEVNAASEIDAGWSGKADRLHQVVASVSWPADLQQLASALTASVEALQAALEAEDLSEVKGAATDVHDAYHELEHEAYPYIAGEEHADQEEGDHADESASPSS